MLSTVTYLDGRGGPTLLLELATTDGVRLQPAGRPAAAFVSYPAAGKHVLFRGDLLHGVCAGAAAAAAAAPAGERLTFLVNW
jgi:hypothetical protein